MRRRVRDVMTRDVVTVDEHTPSKEITQLLAVTGEWSVKLVLPAQGVAVDLVRGRPGVGSLVVLPEPTGRCLRHSDSDCAKGRAAWLQADSLRP